MDEKRVKKKLDELYEIIDIAKNSPHLKDLYLIQLDLIKSVLKLLEFEIFNDVSTLDDEDEDDFENKEDKEENSGYPLIGQIDDDVIID